MSNKNEDIYAQALEEFEGDNRNQGLYAKCFAEADGDENKAKARYIKSRADELTGSVTPEAPRAEEVGHNSEKPKIVGIEKQKKSYEDSRGATLKFVNSIVVGVLGFLAFMFIIIFIGGTSENDWIYGRWEEDPISGINLTRWMEFRKDGIVETGQREKTTTNIRSYEVQGDFVIVDNSISDRFVVKLYYKKMRDGVLARATRLGAVESSDRYYKK